MKWKKSYYEEPLDPENTGCETLGVFSQETMKKPKGACRMTLSPHACEKNEKALINDAMLACPPAVKQMRLFSQSFLHRGIRRSSEPWESVLWKD